jgi:nucleoside-diphosphate-sugar epimerase
MAKRNAEAFLLATTQHTSMHISILRPALVYGPNCKGNLQHMIRAIDRGFFLPIPNVENRRSLISINDICHAAILTAEHPTANRKIYFVTDHNPYSTYHLYSAILQALGKKAPRWHLPLFAYKTLGYMGDILEKIFRVKSPINSHTITKLFGSAEYDSTQIQKEIGFKPKDTLSSLLPTIVAAYRKKLY